MDQEVTMAVLFARWPVASCDVVDRVFLLSSRRRHTIFDCDWSSDVCSSDLFEESVLVEVGSVGGVPLLRTKPSDRQPLDHDKARPGGQEFRLNHLIVESVLFRRDRFRDRKSGVEGKRVGVGGRRIIEIKKNI